MSGETLTINLTTDELKKLIRDEIGEAINNRPTKDDVKELVKSEVDSALSPILRALDKLESNFDKRFNQSDQQLAILVEEVRHNNQTVRDVKDDLDNLDSKVEKTQDRMNRFESTITDHANKIDSQERAIFGDVTRPGTKSLFDHISELGESLAIEMGKGFRDIQTARALDRQEISRIQETTESIRADVEANKQFRLRRQKMERTIIGLIPNVVKKALGDVAWDWVRSKAILATLGATLFSLLLEWLRATS